MKNQARGAKHRQQMQTAAARRQSTKDDLVRQLEMQIWQQEPNINKKAYSLMCTIIERLTDIRAEQGNEESRKMMNSYL